MLKNCAIHSLKIQVNMMIKKNPKKPKYKMTINNSKLKDYYQLSAKIICVMIYLKCLINSTQIYTPGKVEKLFTINNNKYRKKRT